MIQVKLFGSPTCRRYRRMRELILEQAQRLGIQIDLIEIGDAESLSRINPLSLPCLHINERLIASSNPPRPQVIEEALRRAR